MKPQVIIILLIIILILLFISCARQFILFPNSSQQAQMNRCMQQVNKEQCLEKAIK